MLRRSLTTRGHQLMHEPLSNQEHGSLARGKMTHGLTMQRLTTRAILAGTGAAAAFYSMFVCAPFRSKTISSSGKITQH